MDWVEVILTYVGFYAGNVLLNINKSKVLENIDNPYLVHPTDGFGEK